MVGRPLARSLPWLLLAASLSSLFVFSGDRESFYRSYMGHNWTTAKELAVAANLSLQHRLRLFVRLQPDQDGEPVYEMYSRFPTSAYALVKLAILPFDDDLARQVLAARMLTLALFCGAAALAFLALRRIAADPWIALTATLLAFSSFFVLYFSDVAGTHIVTDLFGMMLVLHGMVVHTQDGRFGQLLAKSCVALLLGWHVYALLLPFVALGLGEEAANAWSRSCRQRPSAGRRLRTHLRAVVLALLRSRLLVLAMATLLVGSALLTFNLANEHAALKGEVALADLPSVRSIRYRTGLESEFLAAMQPRSRSSHELSWPGFLYQQIHAVGVATIPYILPVRRDAKGRIYYWGATGILVAGIGVLALGGCLLAPLLGRIHRHSRLPLWALGASGLTWALPMRHNVLDHYFEHLFYVGVPLAAYALLLMLARQRFGSRADRWTVALAIVAALALFLSGHKMSRLTASAETIDLARALGTEFQGIRGKVQGKTVFVTGNGVPGSVLTLGAGPFATAYYLNGSTLQYDNSGHYPNYRHSLAARNRAYDFILSDKRFEHPSLLTPRNRLVFLYDGRAFGQVHDFYLPEYRAEYETIAAGEPATVVGDRTEAQFDVYIQGHRLYYLKEPCVEEETLGIFFLHIVATHLDSLPPYRRESGFDNRDFRFQDRGVLFDGKCMTNTSLPDYDISAIGTGRVAPDGKQAWRVDVTAGE